MLYLKEVHIKLIEFGVRIFMVAWIEMKMNQILLLTEIQII